MHRAFMEAIVKNSADAVAFYQRAFDAKLVADHRNEDGSCAHVELDICGHILALMELQEDTIIGNTMMFALHFGEGNEELVQKAYDILKDGAKIISELGSCIYSPLEADLIDKFGIRWCIFV
jgi:PhnB protein